MCASRITLPPFQYSKGGLMTRPLRDNIVVDEEEVGTGSAEEESKQTCLLSLGYFISGDATFCICS